MSRFSQWAGYALAATVTMALASSALSQSPAAPSSPKDASAPSGSKVEMSEASRQWLEFANELGKAGLRIHELADGARTKEQQGEVNQALTWALTAAVLAFSRMDPDYPEWIPILNSAMLGINNNHDNVYLITRIRGSGSYKIEGDRGRLKFLLLELSNGLPAVTPTTSHIGDYDLNEMKPEPDGRFEVLLSANRPAGFDGNWIALDPKAEDTFLALREVSYDWKKDRDANLSIQRIDRPINMPRRSAADTSERLSQIPKYVAGILTIFLRIQDQQGFLKEEPNRLWDGTKGFGNASAVNIPKQIYQMGEVRLKSDQALVLEGEIPRACDYWSIMLMDTAANTLDFMFHKSGINGANARIDPDGKLRMVISERDPGVQNWLDKGTYEVNGIRGRFLKCGNPVWVSKVVPIEGVMDALYPGTPRVSFDERQKELRERLQQVQHRRRW